MFLESPISFWAWMGTTYLLYLTYSDAKKMLIDERKNYFMMGATASIAAILHPQLWFVMFLIVFCYFIIPFVLKKFKLIGPGDVSAFVWLFFGFGIIPNGAIIFPVFLIINILLYSIIKFIVFRMDKQTPTPFYAVFLFTFCASCVVLGLY